MRISVVIPTYNSAALVVEAVESVLAQTRPAFEVIVVDDGSTDDTAERLAAFGERIKYIPKPNGGVSSARNRGVQEATGECIAFLDADDVWHPRKLEIQLAAFEKHPELAMLGTGTFHWPADSMAEQSQAIPTVEVVAFDRLLVRNAFCTSTIVTRSDALRQAGEFDGTLQGPEDYDMWLRVASRASVGVIDSKLTGYNVGAPNSLSKNAERMERDTLRIIAKHEAMGAFRGKFLLKQRTLSNNALTAAYMYFAAGMHFASLARLGRSYWRWPLPFRKPNVHEPFVRLRLVIANFRRMILPQKADSR
jgi:glycosyltransferase involved in cell wall biosynthesis